MVNSTRAIGSVTLALTRDDPEPNFGIILVFNGHIGIPDFTPVGK